MMVVRQVWSTSKNLARRVLTSGPLYSVARARAHRDRPVTVLMYHTIGGDRDPLDAWTVVPIGAFALQMKHLRAHYEVVSLDVALEHVSAGGHPKSGRPLAVVTFDDGHSGLYQHLLPFVEAERLPVTVFVATGHIESGRAYWFDRAMNALQSPNPQTVDLTAFGLDRIQVGVQPGPANWEAMRVLLDGMKRLPADVRERACDALVEQSRVEQGGNSAALRPMSLAQLQEMARSPWITIGAHTHGHELLDQLEPASARATMALSRERLESWTGLRVRHFAYPNGNYNLAVRDEARALGFASAFTTHKGLWTSGNDLHEVPRVPVGRYDDLARFKWALLGDRVFH